MAMINATFAATLFSPGLLEKGLRGELFTRLVLVISRDYYLSENKPMPNIEDTEPESEDTVVTQPRTKRLRTCAFPSLSTPGGDIFFFATHFNVVEYFEALVWS